MLAAFLYNFFVLAFSEEISKGFMMKRLIKKNDIGYSWLDIIIYMVIIAIGFDILESAFYAFGTSPMQVIVRGATLPHLAYGFIMGYFAGKAIKTGNRAFYLPALFIPWALHGMYDFCLSPIFVDNENPIMALALVLAFMDLILVIVMVAFLRKARNSTKYTEIIRPIS